MAKLRPRLRQSVGVHRHRYRGHRWYLLRDAISGSWQRVNAPAYRLIRLLDGRHDVATAHAAAQHDAAMSEAEAIATLDALNRAELLDWGVKSDVEALHARADKTRRHKRAQQLVSPFSIRFSLFNPDRLLTAQLPLARAVFSLFGLCFGAFLVAMALLLAVVEWDAIGGYWAARGLTTHALVLIPLVYILMKTIHETAHGLAAKRWGAEVHDTGVVLLLLIPIPYVDATAAWAFPQKHRRLVVGAAGIAAELVLAAIATFVFVLVEPGMVKDFAYTAMLLGSLSTLLFNGNPLLRFDGYYMLVDAIEIPNLASRATRYWGYLAQRYVCGIDTVRSPVTAAGERRWFLTYGAAASIYRLGIVITIALFVAVELPVLGVVLGLWAVMSQIGLPLARVLRFIFCHPSLTGRRRRAVTAAVGASSFALVMLLAVPLPLSTYAQGIVWLPEHARVRAGTDGVLGALFSANNTSVAPGTPIARIENPLLDTRIAALEWELRETELRRNAARIDDRVETQVLADAITRLRADLAALKSEAVGLEVTSPLTGRLVIPKASHLVGRYLHKGDVIAYVLETPTPTIRAAVPQARIGLLRHGVVGAHARLAEDPRTTFAVDIMREFPSATRQLPSVALGTLGGGLLPVDVTDSGGLKAAEPLYLVDLNVAQPLPSTRVGGRVHVRFEHPAEPLGFRVYRALRQLLLTRLSV